MMDLSNFIILYVKNVQRSITFYRPLLGFEPVQSSESFALFVSESGAKFGLWAEDEVLPQTENISAGSVEVVFSTDNVEKLTAKCAQWQESGVRSTDYSAH